MPRWSRWLGSWEAQQQALLPKREERFTLICAAVAGGCGTHPRVLDLGSGPGSLALRVARSLPAAEVVAVDRDPVLLEIGRRALVRRPKVSFADRDLADPRLPELGTGFDAAVSSTALHWLDRAALSTLYRSLARMLRPGGLFLNADHLPPAGGAIAELARGLEHAGMERHKERAPSGPRSWDGWWSMAEGAAELSEAFTERRRREHRHPERGAPVSLEDHQAALREAGFAEVGCLWQHLNDRILVAVR